MIPMMATDAVSVVIVDGTIMLDVHGQMMRFGPCKIEIVSDMNDTLRATISGILYLGERVDAQRVGNP